MKKQLIAHCIHHTHWDPYWYFTAQEAEVVFAFDVRRMLQAFRRSEVDNFFLDGQTAALDEYLQFHPEDKEEISVLVQSDNLEIGPFVSQLDPFISSTESVVNNLRLGIQNGSRLGKSSMIAYLSDPFGVSYSFPKIFNQFGIKEFVFTRGLGDIYQSKNDFYLESNDGSVILCHTLLAGYGYGTYGFLKGDLLDGNARDYNLLNVTDLINRLVSRSSLENEFVFPVGFDQNPIVLDLKKRIEKYNHSQSEIEFVHTTWKDYFKHVRKKGKNLVTLKTELTSPQFHRLHLSGMNSARSDIKSTIHKAECSLTFESQPVMSILSSMGLKFDHGLIDQNWYDLVNCQTHASATHGDVTNEKMRQQASEVLSRSNAITNHLTRLTCLSVEDDQREGSDLLVFHTLPWESTKTLKITVISKQPNFSIWDEGLECTYSLLSTERIYGGTLRLDPNLMNENLWFYRSEVVVNLGYFYGFSYKTLKVVDEPAPPKSQSDHSTKGMAIHNTKYEVGLKNDGIYLRIREGMEISQFLKFEDMGDAGDSYDYSPPADNQDWTLISAFEDADIQSVYQSDLYASMVLKGNLCLPQNSVEREAGERSVQSEYQLKLELFHDEDLIRISGFFDNQSEDHRLRLIVKSLGTNNKSFAGIPFGVIARAVENPEKRDWREKAFFEEPSNSKPLLNYVYSKTENGDLGVLTGGSKEYEFTGSDYIDIAITVFRAIGAVGLPDLQRRPGRPSGLSNVIIHAPAHQMKGRNNFNFAIMVGSDISENAIDRSFAEYSIRPIYYQNQRLDTLIEPIHYFPIHPFLKRLPRKYSLLTLKDFAGSYSTLTVSKLTNRILLRLYNASDKSTPEFVLGGQGIGFCIEKTNIGELVNEVSSIKQGGMEIGEVRTLAFLSEGKGDL
ncbi:MAG: glycoside hydrolase family 38 C-terminal domain-containing protein [Anaerolineaceae bacterium]|nr:glycoside hydrolase family 38 C-terminal domain-containing protein [Anaerolineaceae bacterium]